MKAFVYEKKKSAKKVAEIKNVAAVSETNGQIQIRTESNEIFMFDTHVFKTTVYQN